MLNIRYNRCLFKCFLLASVCLVMTEIGHAADQDDPVVFAQSNRWVSSIMSNNENSLKITIHDGVNTRSITQGHRDHKPVWSKEGDMITFFRATGDTDSGPFNLYRTHICVINSDGSGFKELTDAEEPNVNPTWTRDGSNRIIFNRLSKKSLGKCRAFWTAPESE